MDRKEFTETFGGALRFQQDIHHAQEMIIIRSNDVHPSAASVAASVQVDFDC
jgi:hypothetical protein